MGRVFGNGSDDSANGCSTHHGTGRQGPAEFGIRFRAEELQGVIVRFG
jgi:hypothetical protein